MTSNDEMTEMKQYVIGDQQTTNRRNSSDKKKLLQ